MDAQDIVLEQISDSQSGESFGSIYIDIDNFQNYNGVYGHKEGDKILIAIKKIIDDILNTMKCHSVRIGGDKFIIILSHSEVEKTFDIAENIRNKVEDLNIENPINYGFPSTTKTDNSPSLTVSVGAYINNCLPNKFQYSWALEMAEASCVFAKFAGKNTVVKLDLR